MKGEQYGRVVGPCRRGRDHRQRVALALAHRGVRVDLVEISTQWRGVGHGITVQGNVLAALARVGVLDEVLRRGVPFDMLRMRQADGTLIAELPTPHTGGEELPSTMGALRSDLQAVLCDRVIAAGVSVRLGLSVRSVTSDADRAAPSSPTAPPATTT